MAIRQERIERREAVSLRLDFAAELLRRRLPLGLAVGLVLGVSSLVWYDRLGYSHAMLWRFLAGLAVLGAFFAARSRSLSRIARIDLAIPVGLAALFAPLYLIALYRWPVQVSSDEVVVMNTAKQYGSASNVDLFGLSNQLARPALLFVVWGKLGHLIGGIDLFHMRLLEASFGLLGIALSYALFRQILPRGWAALGSCVIGLSHSYLMISRLAMRENTSLLVEVAALTLLLWGLRHDHELATFGGGILAGLGFYVYYPSRATFPIWILFLIGLAFFYRRSFPLRSLGRLGAIATMGFALMAAPIHLAEAKAAPSEVKPLRETLMIYNAGRELQRQWVFAPTQWEGFKTNAKYGLGAFNNTVVDHGFIYNNPGHGFVDPLTGLLLWLGVGVVGIGLIRRRAGPESLLMLGGFLVLWLSFAFLVNKAPNYTRLLVTLPFVAYLVVQAIRWLVAYTLESARTTLLRVDRWRSVGYVPAAIASRALAALLTHSRRFVPAAIVSAALTALLAWNLAIAWDYIQLGRQKGNSIGSTGRYVHAHRNVPGQHFYVSSHSGYFEWGQPSTWQDWLRIFAKNDGQVGNVVAPEDIGTFQATPPFAFFMTRGDYAFAEQDLVVRYPQGRLRNITPDGTRVVFEVPR